MKLDVYLHERSLTQAAFGALFEPPVSQGLVSQWLRGQTRITLAQALKIEALTAGFVTPKDCAELYSESAAA